VRGARRERRRASVAVAAVVLLALGLGIAFWSVTSDLSRREQKLATVELQVKNLEQQTGGVEAAQAEWAALDDMEQLSYRARDPRRAALGLLRDVSAALPEGTWIEEFSYERGRLLRLHGQALRSPSVQETVAALAQLPYLGDVVLDDVARNQIAGKPVFTFTVSCHLPPEEPPKGESQHTRR